MDEQQRKDLPNLTTEPHIQIQELAKQNTMRIKSWMISAAVSMIVFAAVLGLLFGNLITKTESNHQLTLETHQLAVAIQHQRYEDCIHQNEHHDNSLAYIESLARKEAKHASKKKKAELQKSIGEYRILFQALAPHLNCKQIKP